jgi:putative tricarboxylic transport membrane protein
MDHLLSGFEAIFNIKTILVMCLSVTGGIVIGTLPGLSSVMAISLMLPVAYGLGPVVGLSMLGAIYTAALYGGANSAILLNTPGTPSSLPTAFDGFPLTKKGKADRALYGALYASVFGGLFGTIILIAAFEPLARISLQFGPSEFFWLAVLGLCAVASISEGKIIKGLMSACMGLMVAMIGVNPVTSDIRFTFGSHQMIAGVGIIPALLGLFSLSQALNILEMKSSHVAPYKSEPGVISKMLKKVGASWSVLTRGSIVGSVIGILPGAGGAIASIIAYNEARRTSKKPEEFGKGAIEGVLASESANNSQVSSSLVPMMGLGIPGNVNAAVIMGALMSFGIQPGMGLLTNSADVAYAFMASLVVANIVLFFIGIYMVKLTAKVLLIPNTFLGPSVIVLCIVGAYAASYDIQGVWIMFATGILGYIMIKLKVPIGPMALGMVLGPIAEKGLLQSIQLSQTESGLLAYFFSRPITIALIVLCVLTMLAALYVEKKTKQTKAEVEENRNSE